MWVINVITFIQRTLASSNCWPSAASPCHFCHHYHWHHFSCRPSTTHNLTNVVFSCASDAIIHRGRRITLDAARLRTRNIVVTPSPSSAPLLSKSRTVRSARRSTRWIARKNAGRSARPCHEREIYISHEGYLKREISRERSIGRERERERTILSKRSGEREIARSRVREISRERERVPRWDK